jgi:hypothetical protein
MVSSSCSTRQPHTFSGTNKISTELESDNNKYIQTLNKDNNKITELRTILQRESQNS